MQRIIRNVLAILLLLTVPAYAGGAMGLMMAAGSSAVVCESFTERVGSTHWVYGATADAFAADYIVAISTTASCSGQITRAFFKHSTTGSDTTKIGLYSTTGSSTNPGTSGSSNVSLGWSGTLSSNYFGMAYADIVDGPIVTKNTSYWITFATDTTGWDTYKYTTSSNVAFYKTCANCETNNPADLGGAWTSLTAGYDYQIYFVIGSLHNYSTIGPAIIVGDSTIADYEGQSAPWRLLSLTPATVLTNITSIAQAGDTIANQKTDWQAIAEATRTAAKYVIVQIGLNDLNPAESAATALARYQDLVDTIATDSPTARIYTATMTPCKGRLITIYGEENGATAYQKWLDMNTAIAGGGANAITGQYGVITQHTTDLNDGSGNLAAAYEYGGTAPKIHPSEEGRWIVAKRWLEKLLSDGTWY